jgi:hypothetical protein
MHSRHTHSAPGVEQNGDVSHFTIRLLTVLHLKILTHTSFILKLIVMLFSIYTIFQALSSLKLSRRNCAPIAHRVMRTTYATHLMSLDLRAP